MTKQEAIKDLQFMRNAIERGEWICSNDNEALDMAIEALSAQTEIIRCMDCKHSEHWYRDKARCFLWHETGIDVFEDGYCNYAERRTDG